MTSEFNRDDPKYKCLCGQVHAVVGAEIFFGLYAVGAVLAVVGHLPLSLFWLFLPAAVIVCTILAFLRRSHNLLWPFVIVTGISLLVSAIAVAVTLLMVVLNPEVSHAHHVSWFNQTGDYGFEWDHTDTASTEVGEGDTVDIRPLLLVYAVIMLLSTLFNYWELMVVLACQRFFRDQQTASSAFVNQSPPPSYDTIKPSK